MASAQSGGGCVISGSTIDGGGGPSAGGNFSLNGTVGQPDAGIAQTVGGFTLAGGFWTGAVTTGSLPGSVVANLNDSGNGSLREAITQVSSGGTITFQPGLTGAVALTGSELVINKDLTIIGPGPGQLAISGNGSSRVFNILNGNVTISGLTIRDGRNCASTAGGAGLGGGIFNGATLTLADCAVGGNLACGATGTNGNTTVGARNGGAGGNGWGGGIYSTGVLSLVRCTVSTNESRGAAGGSAGSGGSSGTQGTGGAGGTGYGGGIYNLGTASLFNCTFTDNLGHGLNGGSGGSASSAGGAGGVGGNGLGGAVLNDGTLTVLNSTFATNRVVAGVGGAGGIGGVFDGSGGRGGNGDGGNIHNQGTNYLVNATVVGGTTAGGSGGTGSANGAAGQARGGGVFAAASSTFPLNTIIAHNSAASGGADVFNPVTSLGHNLINVTAGSSGWTGGDLLGVAPLLLPLANYGGPTLTLLPQTNSPAFNAGDDAVLAAPWSLAPDQRGGLRRAGAHVDLGAVEAGGFLRITDLRDAGTRFDISFTTEFGWSHHLESKDALVPALPWSLVPGSAFTGNGGGVVVSDTRPRSSTNRFYRAVLTP